MMSLYNDNSCNTIVDRRDHVQYLTVSKSYSDNCTCSLTEQNTTLNKTKLCSGPASPVHIFNMLTIIMQSLNIKE